MAEKLFTDRDDEIRATDLPERLQLREIPHRIPDNDEIQQEARWIASLMKRRVGPRDALTEDNPIVAAVVRVLTFIRIQHLEVPFIVRHRADYFEPLLQPTDIWDIYDLDERWNHIIHRKIAVKMWSAIVPDFDRVFLFVRDEDGVKDFSDFLQLRYRKEMDDFKSSNAVDVDEDGKDTTKKLKLPIRKDTYMRAKEANLGAFAKVKEDVFFKQNLHSYAFRGERELLD